MANRNSAETSVPIMPPTCLNGSKCADSSGGRERHARDRERHHRRMAEREEQADAERPLALLHQLARDIVDGGDVVGVDGMAQAEAVGEQRRAEQQRLVVEHRGTPTPRRQDWPPPAIRRCR